MNPSGCSAAAAADVVLLLLLWTKAASHPALPYPTHDFTFFQDIEPRIRQVHLASAYNGRPHCVLTDLVSSVVDLLQWNRGVSKLLFMMNLN